MSEATLKDRISAYWNGVTRAKSLPRLRWWDSPLIIEHVNRLVSGQGGQRRLSQGLFELAKRAAPGRVYDRGISVGCGTGHKEMELIRAGLVRRFDLYELSTERIRLGRDLAKQWRLEERVTFNQEDAFRITPPGSVDFVHWNNSLHHMLDVDAALSWSHAVLRQCGLFFMDEFVGPSRFQWSQPSLDFASQIREGLPRRYLRNPAKRYRKLSRKLERPSVEFMMSTDPSEAAQSDLILDAVRRHFRGARITLTGGLVYHLALSDVLYNFREEDSEDAALLKFLLATDASTIGKPGLDNHYAAALAFKE